ncbi:MAG: ASCH domain-containing protein [Sporolactobacillus sp.]
MTKRDLIHECWDDFCRLQPQKDSGYTAEAFGDSPEMADRLGQLIAAGIKTATASCYPLYALDGEALPKEGDYTIILDSKDRPLCITETLKVTVIPFDQVSAWHAYLEGEGDRSLSYWRRVHQEFFTNELDDAGILFDPAVQVVCEEFRVVFRPT